MSGAASEALEARIADWRRYLLARRTISARDVDELEDHLRERIADLRQRGLDDDEAFLIGIRRMGDADALSGEYAREHSDRLWKQLLVAPASEPAAASGWRDAAVAIAVGAAAGLAFKLALTLFGFASDDVPSEGAAGALMRTLTLYVAPFLVGYLSWKRRLSWAWIAGLGAGLALLAALVAIPPFSPFGQTSVLAALHGPVVAWGLVGVAYTGGRVRSSDRRMDFVRFTGEFVVYYVLMALGGGVLLGLTYAVFAMVGVDPSPVVIDWILPVGIPGAVLVAAWLVETKQAVVENIAPVLTRIFTPLTLIMLVALLAVVSTAGTLLTVDRELLILMDAILVLVVCLALYEISARDALDRPGWFDGLQLATVLAALAVDAIMLAAMLARIAEFGFSANKTAALGLNLLLLAHLAGHVWLTARAFRARRGLARIVRWHTAFVPLYAVWGLVVVAVFPALFAFA
ncbi:permease prefix domain 1-containing protein [Microbacterium sp. NPDC096154]|uniref:permease prefix domain 1-containing protein n=1 Tax=Microbacterium sp. NPDC096154 TaxID=3155549 RepID=UPI003326D630